MKTVLWVGLGYCVYCGLLYVAQRFLMFPTAMMGPAPAAPDRLREGEIVWLDSGQEEFETWYLPALGASPAAPAPVMIVAHGNAELIDQLLPEFEDLPGAGIGLLLVEYPGYGRSGGSPSQKSITRAFVTAYDMLADRPEVDADRIVVFGRSLGGGAVCDLASRRAVSAMILVSTFTSTRPYAKRYLAPSFLIKDPFDNLAVLGTDPAPVLIVHGIRDTIVPIRHARRLAAASPRARLITYRCGHNDCPPDQGVFRAHLMGFLKEAGVLPPALSNEG